MDPESRGLQFLIHIITIIYLAIVDIIHMMIMIYPYIIINQLFHDWEFTIIYPIYSPYIVCVYIYRYPIIDPFFPVPTGLKCPVNPKGSAASPRLFSQGSKTLSLAACRVTMGHPPLRYPYLGSKSIWASPASPASPWSRQFESNDWKVKKRVLPGPGGRPLVFRA